MKKIFYSAIIGLGVLACTPDRDYESAFRTYVGINNTSVPAVSYEDNGAISIPVYYGGTLKSDKAITVNYKVTGGTYGVDYTIDGGSSANGTVTVAAGDAGKTAMGVIKILPIADFAIEPNVPITITLESASDGVNVGYPYKKEISMVIADDDCEYVFDNLTGVGASVEHYTNGDVYPDDGTTYETNFTATGTDEVSIDNFWDSGMEVALTYDGATHKVSVVERDWSQYGFTWNITGEGSISTCGNSLSVDFRLKSPDYQGGYDQVITVTYQFKK